MAKRYYLTDIIGDGGPDNPYRPALAEHGVDYVAEIATGPDGRPTSSWALALVAAPNHTPLLSDQRLDALPAFPLDAKVNALQTQARNRMQQALARRGIAVDVASADGYRDVVRGIGRQLNPAFSEENFDVADAG